MTNNHYNERQGSDADDDENVPLTSENAEQPLNENPESGYHVIAEAENDPPNTYIATSANSLPSVHSEHSRQESLHDLFDLCEAVSKLPKGENPPNNAAAISNGLQSPNHENDEAIELAWERIRTWLVNHPSPEDRALAAQYHGDCLGAALHFACKTFNPPPDIIRDLLTSAPETIAWADVHSWLPLHYACASGGGLEVIQMLVSCYPESCAVQDKRDRTPLHFALTRNNEIHVLDEEDIIEIVRLLSDGAAELKDENGMLPLHYGCAFGSTTRVLHMLLDAFPASIGVSDKNGRTPLHYVMSNASRPASPGAVELLLSIDDLFLQHAKGRRVKRLVNKVDRDGHLPIDLLSLQASSLPRNTNDQRNIISKCLMVYLNAEPRANADFLSALQGLPNWLRDRAVVNPHVQSILNSYISKRFPTFVRVLDGIFLIVIITCFQVAVMETINVRMLVTSPTKNLYIYFILLYTASGYFMIRELVQMSSLFSLGIFSSWFRDAANWLDMILIALILYYTLAMQYGFGDNDRLRDGVACTIAIAWCAVINFLKTTLVDFAVFVDGIFYVVRRLTAFLVTLSVILCAFAQMFVILFIYTPDCPEDDLESFPHCTFKYSLLRCYSMLMGEMNLENYLKSTYSKILYVIFAFLVVILLSNMLIALVTDSYEVIQNERAAMVFWSNRLDFVAEMNAISSGPWKDRVRDLLCLEDTRLQRLTQEDEEKKVDPFDEMWDVLKSLFDDYGLSIFSLEFWMYLFFRTLTLLAIIPTWLLIGLVSGGWLWPTQVREWLFVTKTANQSRADLSNQTSTEIEELRNEIRRLSEGVDIEIDKDRREIFGLKTEAENLRTGCLVDMGQVKAAMSNIVQMRRRELNHS